MTSRMLDEIREQPEALARTVAALRPRAAAVAALASDARGVVLYARGTSDNAAVYGRYLCELAAGRPAALGAPSAATLYRAQVDLSGTLAVVLSQSGATAELVTTAVWARERGARTVAITNTEGSALAEVCDLALVTPAGEERAVPATKTYTAQLAALVVIAGALGGEAAALLGELDRVPAEMDRLLGAAGEVEDVAGALAPAGGVVVTGRCYTLSTAAEVALKIVETSGMPALGLSHADLQHGPSAVLGAGVPEIVVAAPGGPTLPGLVAGARAARERGSEVVVLGGDAELAADADRVLPGPDLPEALAPLALAVPGQMLAEALARSLGFDPDRPRGLTKVTQTAQ